MAPGVRVFDHTFTIYLSKNLVDEKLKVDFIIFDVKCIM